MTPEDYEEDVREHCVKTAREHHAQVGLECHACALIKARDLRIRAAARAEAFEEAAKVAVDFAWHRDGKQRSVCGELADVFRAKAALAVEVNQPSEPLSAEEQHHMDVVAGIIAKKERGI